MEKNKLGNNGIVDWLKDKWAHNPMFSTLLALLVMVLIQSVVMTNLAGSFAGMFGKMGMAWLNILRNNTYAGIIALGMCFVIISGGIDLGKNNAISLSGAPVIGGMGLKYDEYLKFRDTLDKSGALAKTVMFVHTAADPRNEIELKQPDASPVDSTHYSQKQSNSINDHRILTPFPFNMIFLEIGSKSIPTAFSMHRLARRYCGNFFKKKTLRRAKRLRTARERVSRNETDAHRARARDSPAARRRPSKARSLGRAPQSAK